MPPATGGARPIRRRLRGASAICPTTRATRTIPRGRLLGISAFADGSGGNRQLPERSAHRDFDDADRRLLPATCSERSAVGAGKSLTIPAGATLRFHGNAYLLVNGALTVQGTSANPVTLTSGRASPRRGNWSGVQVSAAGSVIDNALIEWAWTGVNISGVAATVTHSTIRNFSGQRRRDQRQCHGHGDRRQPDRQPQRSGHLQSTPRLGADDRQQHDPQLPVRAVRAELVCADGDRQHPDEQAATAWYVDANFAGGTPAAPVITGGNQIFANGTNLAALRYSNADEPGAERDRQLVGLDVPGSISASITDRTDNWDNGRDYPTVDYSNFLDGPGGSPVPGN